MCNGSIPMLLLQIVGSYDYGQAPTKSLIYVEAQRSERLPDNQLVARRGHSALTDGESAGVIYPCKLQVLFHFLFYCHYVIRHA